MKRTIQILLIILIIWLAILSPALTGTAWVELTGDNEYLDDDFPAILFSAAAYVGTEIPQVTFLLKLGMSIFVLYVVYLGGRSKHKRFNDRTLDIVSFLSVVFSKTALFIRAVFNFPLRVFGLIQIKSSAMKSVLSGKVPGFPVQGGIYP